jgi:hypothetical protein
MTKRLAIALLVIFSTTSFQPPVAHAGFFLFNIINGIFGGNHQKSPVPAPPTASAEQPSGAVKFGMHNSAVVAVQQYLIKSNYLSGKADGVFGYNTLAAVKAFQRDTGLITDGIVGPRTMGALKSFTGTKTKASPAPKRPVNRPPPANSDTPEYLYSLPCLVTA